MSWKVHGRCHKFILLGDCHAVNVVAPFESSVCFCSLKMLMILRHFVALHESQLRKRSTEFLRLSLAPREGESPPIPRLCCASPSKFWWIPGKLMYMIDHEITHDRPVPIPLRRVKRDRQGTLMESVAEKKEPTAEKEQPPADL